MVKIQWESDDRITKKVLTFIQKAYRMNKNLEHIGTNEEEIQETFKYRNIIKNIQFEQ